jgi:phosphoglycolate phosphatase
MRVKEYPERTVEEVRNFIGNGIKVLIQRAVPSGTDNENYLDTLEIFTKYYLAHIADNTRPYDGIPEMLDELKKSGCKIAVVSNKAHEAAKKVVEDFFGNRFDLIVGKLDRFPTKPDPASVFYVMKSLKSATEDCIYIGDSDVDVETAHNAGLPCIGVTWGNRDRAVLEAKAAEYIVDTPNEIIKISR